MRTLLNVTQSSLTEWYTMSPEATGDTGQSIHPFEHTERSRVDAVSSGYRDNLPAKMIDAPSQLGSEDVFDDGFIGRRDHGIRAGRCAEAERRSIGKQSWPASFGTSLEQALVSNQNSMGMPTPRWKSRRVSD